MIQIIKHPHVFKFNHGKFANKHVGTLLTGCFTIVLSADNQVSANFCFKKFFKALMKKNALFQHYCSKTGSSSTLRIDLLSNCVDSISCGVPFVLQWMEQV